MSEAPANAGENACNSRPATQHPPVNAGLRATEPMGRQIEDELPRASAAPCAAKTQSFDEAASGNFDASRGGNGHTARQLGHSQPPRSLSVAVRASVGA